ncbi:AI-2E family transporter, partial [Candidatus Microgenomates bacterium]|nr:AI-2E family transporter [Candidatus Microgenomates bacterium]
MTKIDISHRTIVFTVFFLIGLWFLWQVKQVLLALFIAFLFATALNPIVGRLAKLHIPRWLGIVITYLFIIGA